MRESPVRRNATPGRYLGDIRKMETCEIDSVLSSSLRQRDLTCRLGVPSSVNSAPQRMYLGEVIFGDVSRYLRMNPHNGEQPVSEAIGDANGEARPARFRVDSRKKRHANPYHINLKLYSPVYHIGRAGLGCRPFNKVWELCGELSSCPAATFAYLPQPPPLPQQPPQHVVITETSALQ